MTWYNILLIVIVGLGILFDVIFMLCAIRLNDDDCKD